MTNHEEFLDGLNNDFDKLRRDSAEWTDEIDERNLWNSIELVEADDDLTAEEVR